MTRKLKLQKMLQKLLQKQLRNLLQNLLQKLLQNQKLWLHRWSQQGCGCQNGATPRKSRVGRWAE